MPTLYPKPHQKKTYCQLILKPLSRFKDRPRLRWPRCQHMMTATIVDDLPPCPNGFYAILFDMEANKKPDRQPYVPTLCPSISKGESKTQKPINGSMTELAIGSRVLIKMLEGHLCCPIIIGSVANKKHPSPVKSTNATSAIMRSAKGNTLSMDDDPKKISCQINTPANKQQISINAAPAHYGINIKNTNGDVVHYSKHYQSDSEGLSIQAKKKILIKSADNLQLQSIMGNVCWQAKSIEQRSGKTIQYHAIKNNVKILCEKINISAKGDCHFVAEKKSIMFDANASTIKTQCSMTIGFSMKESIHIKNELGEIKIDPQKISIVSPKVTFSAPVILVSGV